MRLTLTPAGRHLVEQVSTSRRAQLSAIVTATAGLWHPAVAPALRAFSAGAGEVPEDEWWLGWPGAGEPDDNTAPAV